MQRCPACTARLNASPLCPRCGADYSRTVQCKELSKLWLTLALQMLNAKQTDIAIAAVDRSLSFKQTTEARVFRDFLVHHQYQALYECLARQDWQMAHQTLGRLQSLQGDTETLQRFQGLLKHLSAKSLYNVDSSF